MTKKKKLHPLAVIFIVALILVALTILVLHVFLDIRYKNDKIHELKFVGKVQNEVPYSGKVYYYDGRIAELDAEAKTLEVPGGDKYVGALSGYLPHGKGTLTRADGVIFEGDFYEGYCTGNATITYKNGDVYIGEVDHGNCEGFGKLVKTDGTTYEGEFRNNEENGFGITKFADGSVYVGEYLASIKNGKGAYLFSDGDIYVGDFKNDKRTGKGIYIWSKSEEYSSEFETLFDVSVVDGFKSAFLAYFEGDFERHFLEGDTIEATTTLPFFQSLEDILSRNQIEVYIGDFLENELTGYGKYTWLSGRFFEGQFVEGVIKENTDESAE